MQRQDRPHIFLEKFKEDPLLCNLVRQFLVTGLGLEVFVSYTSADRVGVYPVGQFDLVITYDWDWARELVGMGKKVLLIVRGRRPDLIIEQLPFISADQTFADIKAMLRGFLEYRM